LKKTLPVLSITLSSRKGLFLRGAKREPVAVRRVSTSEVKGGGHNLVLSLIEGTNEKRGFHTAIPDWTWGGTHPFDANRYDLNSGGVSVFFSVAPIKNNWPLNTRPRSYTR